MEPSIAIDTLLQDEKGRVRDITRFLTAHGLHVTEQETCYGGGAVSLLAQGPEEKTIDINRKLHSAGGMIGTLLVTDDLCLDPQFLYGQSQQTKDVWMLYPVTPTAGMLEPPVYLEIKPLNAA